MTDSIPTTVSIAPLLKQLSTAPDTVSPAEITTAIDHIFTNQLSPVQAAALLTALHFTGLDVRPEIIAAAAEGMRGNGLVIDGLEEAVKTGGTKCGAYEGGLVDIVGTGGDGHNTFNVSTSSAILASSYLRVAKHGNKASTSSSGSADLLTTLGANLSALTPERVVKHLKEDSVNPSTFCFLFAPVFHPAMRFVAPLRRELGFRSVFNLLGPLVNPIDYSMGEGLEARIIGVSKKEHGQVFAETLRILGARKSLVVCGAEGLDEISPSGETYVWKLTPAEVGEDTDSCDSLPKGTIEHFTLHPTRDFGLPTHDLSTVAGGKSPEENAVILRKLMRGELADDDPILHFVLINTAALFVIAGLVDGEGVEERQKWRLGVEKAKEAISSGRGWEAWERYVEVSNSA